MLRQAGAARIREKERPDGNRRKPLELAGEQRIAAPRQRVWEQLFDPQILRHCIPGCEEVVRHGDTAFEARVLTRIGPLRARFSGRVDICEIDAPAGCTLKFEGGAGSVGMAHGQSRVTLEEVPDGTLLRYAAQAAVGGKLNQIGGRLLDASARKMADDFFRVFSDRIAAPDAIAATADSTAPEPATEAPRAQPGRVAAPVMVPAAMTATAGGWSGELQRFFWLATGTLLGGIIGYLLRLG